MLWRHRLLNPILKADKALENSTALQPEIQTLHLEEGILHERLVILNHVQHQNNLKFRRVPQEAESCTDLGIFTVQ